MISNQSTANWIGQVMTYAILTEAATWPSPGLVSPIHTGSHQDMNIYTFMRSAVILAPYFVEAAKIGQEHAARCETAAFFPLKTLGIQAEADMLVATGGVNTHKGTIFLGLILSAAAGLCYARDGRLTANHICLVGQEFAAPHLLSELDSILHQREPLSTTGMRAYKEWGLRGIRGEVIDGFPTICRHSLPAFESALSHEHSWRETVTHALLILMSMTEDTTVLNRGFALESVWFVQDWAKQVLRAGSLFTDEGKHLLEMMHQQLIEHNLSPGGSADLVSMTIALYLWEHNQVGVIHHLDPI